MRLNIKRSNWITAPNASKLWICIPVFYTLFIQILTGFPRPGTLHEVSAHEFFIKMSEKIFDYPFWIQDLSHFPLFLVFGWLWLWYLRRKQRNPFALFSLVLVAFSYAIINEFTQFFIPQRFPSINDVIMNLLGMTAALFLHLYSHKN